MSIQLTCTWKTRAYKGKFFTSIFKKSMRKFLVLSSFGILAAMNKFGIILHKKRALFQVAMPWTGTRGQVLKTSNNSFVNFTSGFSCEFSDEQGVK
jgi:hypothetical protein